MPSTTTAKHPRLPFSITFTEEGHTYIDNENSDYLSTTTLVGKFFPEFDAPAKAEEIAARENRLAMDILTEWNRSCAESCAYGTRVHEYAEACILGLPTHKHANEKERHAFIAVDTALVGIRKHYEIVSVEAIVFDPVYRIAGSIYPTAMATTTACSSPSMSNCFEVLTTSRQTSLLTTRSYTYHRSIQPRNGCH